jgi:hypothetical protein
VKLTDLQARITRLDRLSRGHAKEIVLMKAANDPLLYLERKTYLHALHDALAGVEGARVALARARQRLERCPGKGGANDGTVETNPARGAAAGADRGRTGGASPGLADDDPALLQGLMTMPPPLEILGDWQVEGADLLAYPAWQARGLVTVKEVEECAWALCSAIDARLGEGAVKELLAWYDATPRVDVLAVLLGEVEQELMMRMVRQAAGAAGRTA